jgi:hypothetical protein
MSGKGDEERHGRRAVKARIRSKAKRGHKENRGELGKTEVMFIFL